MHTVSTGTRAALGEGTRCPHQKRSQASYGRYHIHYTYSRYLYLHTEERERQHDPYAAVSPHPSPHATTRSRPSLPPRRARITLPGSTMARPRSLSHADARRRALAAVRPICLGLFVCLLVLVAFVQFSQELDTSVCDTARASEHPLLCGTSRRVCRDAVGVETTAPLVVVAAGATRAGSTWLFNALRILMRIRDPNTVSGWHRDLAAWHEQYAVVAGGNGSVGGRAEAFRRMGTSVLVKVHLLQDWDEFQGGAGEPDVEMESDVDAVFTSFRDVRQVVRSVRDMGWGVDVDLQRMRHPDFCKKRVLRERGKWLGRGAYRDGSVWVRQALATIRCRSVLLEAAGGKLKMDVKAEDMRGLGLDATVKVLGEMGEHLDYAFSPAELEAAARELLRLRAPLCGDGGETMDVNPVTHFHRGHTRVGKSAAAAAWERGGMAAIGRDAECGRWLRRHGYV